MPEEHKDVIHRDPGQQLLLLGIAMVMLPWQMAYAMSPLAARK